MRSAPKHRGFSFAEVMFAVVILGIGFILVASIFPVAMQQTQSNNDDAVAAQLARDAVKLIAANTTADQYTDPIGQAAPFKGQLWDQVSSSLICPVDHRYAWVPYAMKMSEGTIQISVVVVRRVLSGEYTSVDTANGELVPRGVSIISAAAEPDGTISIDVDKSSGTYAALAPGAILYMTSGLPGRSFRLKELQAETPSLVTWSVDTAGDVAASDFAGSTAAVTGRDWANPSSAPTSPSDYAGPAQDVAVYTTFILPNQTSN